MNILENFNFMDMLNQFHVKLPTCRNCKDCQPMGTMMGCGKHRKILLDKELDLTPECYTAKGVNLNEKGM